MYTLRIIFRTREPGQEAISELRGLQYGSRDKSQWEDQLLRALNRQQCLKSGERNNVEML